MNRREMLQTGLAVLSAVGVDGEVATVSAKNPQMFVIRVPEMISCDSMLRMGHHWKIATQGTPMQGIPVIVLENGASLEVVDKVD